MTIRNRLKRLEARYSSQVGRCPNCPPITIVNVRRADNGEYVAGDGHELPAPCQNCGRPAEYIGIVEAVMDSREEPDALAVNVAYDRANRQEFEMKFRLNRDVPFRQPQ